MLLLSAVRCLLAALRASVPGGRDWGTRGFGVVLLCFVWDFVVVCLLAFVVFLFPPTRTVLWSWSVRVLSSSRSVFESDPCLVLRLSLQLIKLLKQFPCSWLPGAGMAGKEMASRLLPLLSNHLAPPALRAGLRL